MNVARRASVSRLSRPRFHHSLNVSHQTRIDGKRVTCRAHGYETREEAAARRIKESQEVEDRVTWVDSIEGLKTQLRAAGNKLVLVELQSDSVCEAGFEDEPELLWKEDIEAANRRRMAACTSVKHTFARTARECTDVVFLSMQVPDDHDGKDLMRQLGVELLPAIQFYREGQLLWQQQGFQGMEREMSEGVLYYGNAAAGGLKATEYVHDIGSRVQLDKFIHSSDKDVLKVVNVSTTLCKPCIKVYPAVLALAKNFVGYAEFGRLMGDDSDETEDMMRELGILEVPTFIFYRNGRELGRHVGSSRGDLIGQILTYQSAAGLKPPPPPPKQTVKARPVQKQRSARRW